MDKLFHNLWQIRAKERRYLNEYMHYNFQGYSFKLLVSVTTLGQIQYILLELVVVLREPRGASQPIHIECTILILCNTFRPHSNAPTSTINKIILLCSLFHLFRWQHVVHFSCLTLLLSVLICYSSDVRNLLLGHHN